MDLFRDPALQLLSADHRPGALVHLRRLEPHTILHAGDIGDPAVLDALAEIAPCSTGAIRVASDLVFV